MKVTSHSKLSSFSIKAVLTDDELSQGCRLGMDSHADMSCLGKHARILEILENQSCSVYPFNDSYAPMTDINVVNGAFALDLHLFLGRPLKTANPSTTKGEYL